MTSIRPTSLRPRATRTCLALLLALLCGTGIGGCAGTARGTTSPVYQSEPPSRPSGELPAGPEALVVIRYPALIHADAEHSFYQAFGNRAIGDPVAIEVMLRTDMTRVAQAVVAKSNYYAMSLYRELRAVLPEDAVLLSPHMITWSREDGLRSRPMLAAEQIPAVLTIDFSVYSYPDIREVMESPPLTFGDIVTPLLVVHGNRWLRPATHGLVLSSDPLLQSSWQLSRDEAAGQRAGMLEYPAPDFQRPLDFTAFLSRAAEASAVPSKPAGDFSAGDLVVEAYPLEKVQMDPLRVAALAESGEDDPFADSFVAGAARRIVQLLHEVDFEHALFLERYAALRRFDPELAEVFLTRDSDESVRARLQLADALIRAEKTFVADQSEKVYEGTYGGDYGRKMRQMIVAEYGMLEERRRLARIQNVTTALTVAMLAGSVYGTSVSGTAIASALQSITPVLVLGSIWTARSALRTRAQSANVTEKFMSLMAPELDRQIDVQVEWMESRERITARGFAEFRDKTIALYQSRLRALDTSASPHCEFRHPGYTGRGRWFGRCEDGLAAGRGYGVLEDESGNAVEYLGTAERGQAEGEGGMLVERSGEIGPSYYEGRFHDGLPDGVVALQQPGGRPRLLRFEAGTESGRATEREWTRPQF